MIEFSLELFYIYINQLNTRNNDYYFQSISLIIFSIEILFKIYI
jgi:hypothetical protein